jgi:hypothetical protein
MIGTVEKDKIFSDIFGFEPNIEENTLSTQKEQPIVVDKNKVFSDIFGFEPDLSEPTTTKPVQQPIVAQQEPPIERPTIPPLLSESLEIKPLPAEQQSTRTADPLLGEKYKAVAESESPVEAGLKQAGESLVFSDSPMMQARREVHPVASMVGEVGETLVSTVAGGAGALKLALKVPKLAQIAKTGKLGKSVVSGLSLAASQAMDYMARNNEQLASEDSAVAEEAKKNLVINIASTMAAPGVSAFLPKNLIQPFAQAAADVAIETAGQAATGDNAFDKEHRLNTMISGMANAAFGLTDVKGLGPGVKTVFKHLKKIGEFKPKSEGGVIQNGLQGKTETEIKVAVPSEQTVIGPSPEVAAPATTPDLSIRKRGFMSESGGTEKGQLGLPPLDPTRPQSVLAHEAQRKFDEQDADIRAKFVIPIKKKIRNATDAVGAALVDRAYYAKRLLGKDGDKAIGALNSVKGNSAVAKMEYDAAEKDISSQLSHDKEKILNRFLQAKRTVEIEDVKGEGVIKHTKGMTRDEADSFLKEISENHDPETVRQLEISSQKYWNEVSVKPLKELLDEGIIDQQLHDILREQGKYYSPRRFIQHIDPDATSPVGGKVGLSESGIKKLEEGSDEAMVNNWRLLLAEVKARTQTRIFKNKASRELYNYVNNNPTNEIGAKIQTDKEIDGAVPAGFERISSMVDGKRQAIIVPTKFANSWNQTDFAMNRHVATLMNVASGGFLLRPLATGALAPEFALTNIVRDAAMQWLTTKEYGVIAPVAAAKLAKSWIRVVGDAWTGKGRYKDYLKQGGGMDYLTEQGSMFKDPTQIVGPTKERNRQIYNIATKLQQFSERLGRLALRDQAIRNGKTPEEATRVASEYLDFRQGGWLTKALDNASPYLNASAQGTRSLVKAFKTDATGTGLKALQLMVVGASTAYLANQYRKETWEDIGDREKVSRWNFPLPFDHDSSDGKKVKSYLSIPKDQSARVFSTIGEVFAERQIGTINGDQAWRKIGMAIRDINPVDLLGIVPPTLSAVLGMALNKDFWTKKEIWTGREVSQHMEYYEGETPRAFVDAAEQLSNVGIEVSPAKIEYAAGQVMPANFIAQFMGGTYDAAVHGVEKKEKEILNKTVYQQLSGMPGARKFLRTTYPSRIDEEQLSKDIEKYGVSVTDEKGRNKNSKAIQNEIYSKKRNENDERQRRDNTIKIVAELLKHGSKENAVKKWNELRSEAMKSIGEKEVNRIDRRLNNVLSKQ